jgi:hypothetical protein
MMAKKHASFFFFLFFLGLLSACDKANQASTSSSAESTPTDWPYEKSVTFIAEGTAMKGTVQYATISAIGWLDQQTVLLDRTETDANGQYRLGIPEAYLGPIEFQLTTTANKTKAKCDHPGGCGTTASSAEDFNQNGRVDFGEFYLLPSNFKMSALWQGKSSASAQAVTVSLTPTSTLSASAAKARMNPPNSSTILSENEKLTQAFGLSQNIIHINPADLTTLTATETPDALMTAFINASFLQFSSYENMGALIEQNAKKYANERATANTSSSNLLIELTQQASLIAQSLDFQEHSAVLLSKKRDLENLNSTEPYNFSEEYNVSQALDSTSPSFYTVETLQTLDTNHIARVSYENMQPFITFFDDTQTSWPWIMQWMMIPLIPELAETSLCPLLEAPYASLCQNIGLIKHIDILCLTFGVTLQGTTDFCTMLEQMSLINSETLKVDYSLKNKTITIKGIHEATYFDVQIVASKNNLGKMSLALTGEISQGDFLMKIKQSTWELYIPTDLQKQSEVPISVNAQFSIENKVSEEKLISSAIFSIPLSLDWVSVLNGSQSNTVKYTLSGSASSQNTETLPFTLISTESGFNFAAF